MYNKNYNRLPSTKFSGEIFVGWESIISILKNTFSYNKILIVDLYVGTNEGEIIDAFSSIETASIINVRNLLKNEEEIKNITDHYMTGDLLFGYRTSLRINDFFDLDKVAAIKQEIDSSSNNFIFLGTGASFLDIKKAITVYVDMARWEIQQRFRRNEVSALGIDNRNDAFPLQYKRGYFIDWVVCDYHKEKIFERIDFWIDTHISNNPKMIDNQTYQKGIETTINSPFRVVPFFDPAPWGGDWMMNKFNLNPDVINYGWCFDCVPEENSLLFEINNVTFELPSINLVLSRSNELLGESVVSRFGKNFPIRFDLLDTFGGGNLSLQVHPTTHYIYENFGLMYTQDESYYIIDAKENGSVFLGLKPNVNRFDMIADLKKSQINNTPFDTEKYVNKYSVSKHDHLLIPAGTIHCSGKDSLVLEISSTPNLFTFKLWDWGRLGLDGKPRPINIDRGNAVIDWSRDTSYVENQLINHVSFVEKGNGWIEERTGLHPSEFIETRRHKFSSIVKHYTNNSVNVLNLVEGDEIIVESPNNLFNPLIVHYAETFIVPAHINEYTIRPYGQSNGKECITIKAYVRF